MFSGERLDFPYQCSLLTNTISRSRYSASYRGSSMKSSAAGSADQRCQTLDTLTVFIFAIVNHPEVQERARAELNAVVGSDRLPEMEDRPKLPYIERMVQETFRCVEFDSSWPFT